MTNVDIAAGKPAAVEEAGTYVVRSVKTVSNHRQKWITAIELSNKGTI
ncbi:MAG: hypothetical protein IJI57_04520 [Flexilinea sp.]|nr:hypothetical protein [Flexilinea sp.]